MSYSRARERTRLMRWAYGLSAFFVIFALIFLFGGHWILGIGFAIVAVLAVSVTWQLRSVR
jgi:hypothetical protein